MIYKAILRFGSSAAKSAWFLLFKKCFRAIWCALFWEALSNSEKVEVDQPYLGPNHLLQDLFFFKKIYTFNFFDNVYRTSFCRNFFVFKTIFFMTRIRQVNVHCRTTIYIPIRATTQCSKKWKNSVITNRSIIMWKQLINP